MNVVEKALFDRRLNFFLTRIEMNAHIAEVKEFDKDNVNVGQCFLFFKDLQLAYTRSIYVVNNYYKFVDYSFAEFSDIIIAYALGDAQAFSDLLKVRMQDYKYQQSNGTNINIKGVYPPGFPTTQLDTLNNYKMKNK